MRGIGVGLPRDLPAFSRRREAFRPRGVDRRGRRSAWLAIDAQALFRLDPRSESRQCRIERKRSCLDASTSQGDDL